jgi:hypothetical protein
MPNDTYINLVNRVLKPFNEVQLTEGNFATVNDGFHQHAKDTVNDAIYDICIHEDTLWPFLWNVGTVTTATDGTTVYDLSQDAAAVQWNSFKVIRDDLDEISATKINEIDYDIYNKVFWARDNNMEDDEYGSPARIARTRDNRVVISPPSDKAYTIQYDYYSIPDRLVNSTDETVIPKQFSQIIIHRALQYLHMFRNDMEASQLSNIKYETNIANMKRILIRRSNIMIPL